MTRLEFPERPSESKGTPEVKKVTDRLLFPDQVPKAGKTAVKLFSDAPTDHQKNPADEVKAKFPHLTDLQLSYAGNLIKLLTPLTEVALSNFGLRAQEAQAEFIEWLAEHTKKMEMGEVAKLIARATETASKPKSFLGKLLHEEGPNWASYKALGLHLQSELDGIQTNMTYVTNELALQKDRLPVHLAALSVVMDQNPTADPDLLQLADSRRRALTLGVQQAGILHNQVKQMHATLVTMKESLNTFLTVTLPALELKATLE